MLSGLNTYEYVRGNPILFSDILGLFSDTDMQAANDFAAINLPRTPVPTGYDVPFKEMKHNPRGWMWSDDLGGNPAGYTPGKPNEFNRSIYGPMAPTKRNLRKLWENTVHEDLHHSAWSATGRFEGHFGWGKPWEERIQKKVASDLFDEFYKYWKKYNEGFWDCK